MVAFVASLVASPRWRVIVPGTVFTIAALLAVRNVVMASVVLAVVSAPGLVVAHGQLRTSDSGPIARILLAGSVGLALVATLAAIPEPLDVSDYPVAEMELLDAEGYAVRRVLPSRDRGELSQPEEGERRDVFVDDRFDFYPQQVIDDLEVMLYGGDYASVIDRYDPAAILWKSGGGFEAWLRARRSGWSPNRWPTTSRPDDESDLVHRPAGASYTISRSSRFKSLISSRIRAAYSNRSSAEASFISSSRVWIKRRSSSSGRSAISRRSFSSPGRRDR